MSSLVKKERNRLIQVYRCILSFEVVLVHTGVDLISPGHKWIWALIEISMPLFFIISGYFLYTDQEQKMLSTLRRRMHAMIQLSVTAIVAYYLILLVANALQGDMANYYQSYCRPRVIVDLFLFNIPQICQPLWFLVSMSYALVLMYVMMRLRKLEILYRFVPLLLIINLILSGELNRILPVQFDGFYARYFLFFATPFLLIGMLIHRHQEKILSSFSNSHIMGLCLLFCILSGIEGELIGTNALLVFEIPAAIFWFLLALKNPNVGKNSVWERIGTRNSLHIYVMHRIFVLFVWKLEPYSPLPVTATKLIECVFIFVGCIFLSECYLCSKERMMKCYAKA